jgi:hypothetical protein
VDFIDSTDYDFLLPRRVRQVLAVGLIVGIAWVPPVQRWWIDQINTHAEHVTRELVARFVGDDTTNQERTRISSR